MPYGQAAPAPVRLVDLDEDERRIEVGELGLGLRDERGEDVSISPWSRCGAQVPPSFAACATRRDRRNGLHGVMEPARIIAANAVFGLRGPAGTFYWRVRRISLPEKWGSYSARRASIGSRFEARQAG